MASKRNKAILSTADLLLSQVGEEEISKTEDKEKTYKEIEDIVLAKKNYTTRTFKEFIVKNGKKLDLITWKDNGKVKGLYVDPLIALSFKTQTVENLGQLLSITNFFNNIARSLFIKYNLKFIQRNAPRDVQAAWKAMQMLDLQGTGKFGMKKADYIIKMKKARKELADFYSSEGRLKSKNVQKALDLKILGVERDYTYNDKDIEAMSTFEREMVTRGLRKKDGSTDKKKIWQTAQKPLEVWEVLNGSLESSTKLAAMMQIEERLAEEGKTIDAKTAAFIRNKVGTPNWRKGGLYKRQMNALYLFSNVNIQGWKRSIELATDANTRSGYIWRTAMIAAPTFLMKAIEMGLFDNPDADDDKKLSIMMKSIKNYYKQKTVIFAVPGWEDSHGQQRGLSMPLDYTDEAIHGMVWELLGSLEDGELKTQELFSIMASIFPDITPTIDVARKWLQYAKDLNPYDDYYGNNWISKENMELGGMYALKDMLKKTWNSFFSGIYRVETYDMPKGKSLADKVLDKTPFVVSSSYGLKEESDKEARDSINKGNLENKEEQKIIIEHLRNFYDDGEDIKNFSKYMNKATDDYIDKYSGEIIKSDITYFRKKFAKKYIGQEDIQIRAILSSGDTLEEISRIKSFLKTSSNETYENFKEFALTNKIITWKSFYLAEKKEDE